MSTDADEGFVQRRGGGDPEWPTEVVAERDDTIRDLLWALERQADRLDTDLGQTQRTIESLHAEVAERDRAIRWLHGEVAKRDETIEWLHREVAQRDETLARLRAGGS